MHKSVEQHHQGNILETVVICMAKAFRTICLESEESQ